MKRTLFKHILFYFSVVVIALSFTFLNANDNDYYYDEIIYKVENLDEANALAFSYDIELKNLSPSGIATYYIDDFSNIDVLKQVGFSFNSTATISSPPWQSSTNEDPYLDQQYSLDVMNTIESWAITEGSSNVTVAVIDTGIDIFHDEFTGRISSLSYNSVTETVGLDAVMDDQGHGTMVTGVIAALKNNSIGIAGITSNVQIMIIKANAAGEDTFQDSAIIEGIYYAVDNGADIINLSLGGSYANPLLKDAVDYAKTNEVIVVAASGNDGTDEAIYPAAFDSTISVSSIDETLNIASYSNYGETIDISAPGSNIITTIINNSYASVSGTSFAAPQVAGALALMLSYYPEITYDEAIQRFLLSSVDYGEEGYDQYYGHGIANTFNALTFDFAMVSFETFGASPIDSFYQKVNTTLSIPETPKLEDYAFMGWYKDINFIDPWIFETDRVLENMTLYAKFNKEYHEVTLISNGIIQDTILVKNGETINLPSSSLEGYNFIGWTTDIDNLNFYDNSQIYSNLTLYACFEEIIYHNVSLYVDSNLVDIIAVESGTTYNINSYEKLGYDFDGWYSDETYSTLYVNNQIIQSDVSVYARFTPRIYRVTLLVDGMIFDEIDVTYNQIPSLSTPTKENSYFIDWYIDEELTLIYNDSPITSDLSLYARFEFEAYSVTYFIDDNSYTEWHSANELFYPSNPEKEGYTFNGWYIDEEYTNLYNPILLNQNIDIYGFFELEKYHVVFYEYDQETIIFETYISYGESILPPTITNLPESIFFTYTFSNWSEPTDFVTNDLSIYPIYNKDYIEGSISLNKGIDTISAGQTWINAGISDLDDSLTLVIDGNVDNLTPGKYTIKYHIYDEDVIIDTITRIIKVTLPNREVIIELNKSISTILLGGTYQEAGATCEYGDVLIESFVDTNKEGVYIVKYSVVVNEKTYEKIRYVHVISENDNKLQIVYWSSKKEDTYEA